MGLQILFRLAIVLVSNHHSVTVRRTIVRTSAIYSGTLQDPLEWAEVERIPTDLKYRDEVRWWGRRIAIHSR